MPLTAAGPLKPVEWIGSALADLRDLPNEPRRAFGYAIHLAQLGRYHRAATRLKGDLAGLIEVVDDFDRDTYRAIYTVKLAGVVYVLHVFQKKSKSGIATPKPDVALIRQRLQRAKAHYAQHHISEEM